MIIEPPDNRTGKFFIVCLILLILAAVATICYAALTTSQA